MEYCPKCGAPLKTDKEFCIRCGSLLTKEALSGEKTNFNAEYIKKEKIDFDSLLELYVGKRYKAIDAVNFSTWNLIFPIFYSFYRRYYSMAILTMIVFGITNTILELLTPYIMPYLPFGLDKSLFTPFLIMLFFDFVVNYLLSKTYNRKYLLYASGKVKKIMYSDKNKDAETLRRKCKRRGNPSILYCFIGWFITVAVAAVIAVIISLISAVILVHKQKNAYKVGNEFCESVNKNMHSFTDRKNTVIDLETVKGLGDYKGKIMINSLDNSIYLYAVSKDDIYCSGTCGKNVKCEVVIEK